MTFATLPATLTLNDTVYLVHWRTRNHVVLQNYSDPVPSTDNPCTVRNQIAGQNLFHVFEVTHNPGESLGQELGTFTDLQGAMTYIEKQEGFA